MRSEDLHILLRRLLRGDENAAKLLWDQCAPGLVAYARSLCGNEHDADDAVATVFCALLHLSRREARSIGDVRAYLAGAVRHAVLNIRRTETRQARRTQDAGKQDAPDETVGPDDSVPQAHAFILKLEARDREIMILHHATGLTFDQIASVLDENRNTIAGRYRRALIRLRAGDDDSGCKPGSSHGSEVSCASS